MGQDRRVRRRAGRRTNVALLVLLTLAFATGWAAFGTGTTTPARVVTALHGAAGLALVLLVPWKSLIVRRSRAFRSVSRRAAAGVVLGVLVAVSLLAGVVHVLGGFRTYAGLTAMQVHVGAAVIAVPFAVLHVLQHPQRPRRTSRWKGSPAGSHSRAGTAGRQARTSSAPIVRRRCPSRSGRSTLCRR